MKERAIEQARALYAEVPDRAEVLEFERVMRLTPELTEALSSPVIRMQDKLKVIQRVTEEAGFSDKIRNFLAELTKNHMVTDLGDISEAYARIWDRENHFLKIEAIFAKTPTDAELKDARDYIAARYQSTHVQLCVEVDPSILGGRILQCRGREFDQSYRGRLGQLEKKLTEEAY